MIKRIISGTLAVVMLLTMQVFAEKNIDSATWQDPQNVILQWQNDGKTYEIHRSDKIDGEYIHMDNSDTGSYRDADAKYPNTYYYKLKDTKSGQESAIIKSGENPQQIRSVYVIMYHHFVTELDIVKGTNFSEYTMMIDDFEEDLKWLRDNGFTTITSADFLKYLKGEISLPEKAIIIVQRQKF